MKVLLDIVIIMQQKKNVFFSITIKNNLRNYMYVIVFTVYMSLEYLYMLLTLE